MNLTILGCGRWGSFLALYGHRLGHSVLLWGRERSPTFRSLLETRANEYVALPPSVGFTSSLSAALDSGESIIISIPSQNLRSLGKRSPPVTRRGRHSFFA